MTSNKNISMLKKQATKAEKDTAHFFNPIDKGSSMPSWYYERQIEEDEEWVSRTDNLLKRGLVPPERIERLKHEKSVIEGRLREIKAAHKVVKDAVKKDKDKWHKKFKEWEEQITDSMPTRDEMNHSPKLINPRLEAARMPDRARLIKAYKIVGHILGEEVNVEALRR